MGSCCQDEKLEGDAMPLGVGADKSTKVHQFDANNISNCIHYGSDTYSKHNNVILVNTIKETEEECQIAMGAAEDNAQHRLEQPTEVSDNGKKKYNEESVCIMNANKLKAEMFKQVGVEKSFNELPDVSNGSRFDANDCIIEANISENKNIEKLLATASVSERNKFKYQKETDLIGLQQAESADAIKQEIDEFHDLSPLRTNGIASYVGPLASVVFDSDPVRNEFDAITFVSSGLGAPQNNEIDCAIGKSAPFTSTTSSCSDDPNVGCGRNESNSSSIIVLRRKNPSCGASLKKISVDGKHCKLSETRNSRRNRRKTVVNVDPTFLLSSIKLSDKYKRKRSLLHRSQHISVWGQLKNVTEVFEQHAKSKNYGSKKCNSTNEKLKEVKPVVDNRKPNYAKILVPSSKQSEAKHNDMQVGDSNVESPSPQDAYENFVETDTSPDSDNVHEANMSAPQLDEADTESKKTLKNNNPKQKSEKSVDYDNGSTGRNNFSTAVSVHEKIVSDCLEESCQMKRTLAEQDRSCSKSGIQTTNAQVQSRQKVRDQNQMIHHFRKSDIRSSRTGVASAEAGDNTGFCHEKTTTSVMIPTLLGCNSDENLIVPEQLTTNGHVEQSQAWVLCDDCEKWRCIPVELANSLDKANAKWTCKDNPDTAFSDCSVPQEKSNEEIDAELGIHDEDEPSNKNYSSGGVQPLNLKDVAASQHDSWTPIKSNVFLHRSRRTQNIDEIMVCQCKPSQDGRHGCGDECLNRMLNIECVKGTCPCHDLCSNQRFQRRKYAKFEFLRCGKKGYGLQLLEDVYQGQFLIEYVGEVLDLASYEARQRYYASIGQKHFYFMTLNGGEVIDARSKGNLGRYVNHSCEPNCRTEKWMVNGEVCIGLFAIRDVKKGEEITFDYNYERVFGAAAKKCICGSSKCRGYLGGDPLNSEIIVDSDEDDLEPATIHEKYELEPNLEDCISTNGNIKLTVDEEILERNENSSTHPPTNSEPKLYAEVKTAIVDHSKLENNISIQPMDDSKQFLNSNKQNGNIFIPISKTQPSEISVHASAKTKETLSDPVLDSKKPQITAKADSLSKASRLRGSVKIISAGIKSVVSHKTELSTLGAVGNHFNGVEEKLNELLDKDGGISKQRDSTKGYLKLLFVTAAEGDVGGCASRSARDLSIILDAIQKTRSRKVLLDVINKNGLQMLHNLIKQNRSDFLRIPIIRKLLKILEFLADHGILTRELINKDPPHNGIESFKQSIIKLTGHNDKQIHTTARQFRDNYITRKIKTVKSSSRYNPKSGRQLPPNPRNNTPSHNQHQTPDSRESNAIVVTGSDVPSSSTEHNNTPKDSALPSPSTDTNSPKKPRKRKSRWDVPSDPKRASNNADAEEISKVDDPMQVDNDYDDDAPPPGFENMNNNNNNNNTETTAIATDDFCMGCPQDIYYSHLPMSFGMPVDLMDKFGTLESGENQFSGKWEVAPAMPYQPFPPLPSYPRKERTVHTNNGCRKPMFKERPRWQNKNFHHGFGRRDMSHRRNGFNKFSGNMRSKPHNFGRGNIRRGSFHPNSMNSCNFNGFGSNFHRPYH